MATDEESGKRLESFAALCTLMRDINADFVTRETVFVDDKAMCLYSDEKQRIVSECDLDRDDKFCLFEEVSGKYFLENFHSDMLATILNPYTKEIGSSEFLKVFLRLIDAEAFEVNEDVEIEREKGRTDILIKNGHQAIILENKMNGAPDQPNQLARYVQWVKSEELAEDEESLEVVKVVYLVKACKSYAAEYDRVASTVRNYDDEYAEEKDFLLSDANLLVLAAVTPRDEPKNLVRFLDECISVLPQDERWNTARFCLEQYKILVQHIGGNVYMETPQKELIKAIYSDGEKLRLAMDFAEVWENKNELFCKFLLDEVQKRSGGLTFLWNWDNIVKKDLSDGKVEVYFSTEDFTRVSFGYVLPTESTPFRNPLKDSLKELIQENVLPSFGLLSPWTDEDDKEWIYRTVDIENVYTAIMNKKLTLDSFIDDICKQLKTLEDAYDKTFFAK